MPVLNLYGSTETGHLLMENERGEMKPGYDTAFLEIVDAGADGVGELVVTTLTNDYMPLLRYRIGDLAEKRAQPYGNHFVVHGRARDALRGGDGRRVTAWQVDECFSEADGIAHYELRQDAEGNLRIAACARRGRANESGIAPRDFAARRTLLRVRAEIKTETMPVLLPLPSGKFRLTCPAPTTSVV